MHTTPRPSLQPCEDAPAAQPLPRGDDERIRRALLVLEQQFAVQRRLVHAGDTIFRAGEAFSCLHVIHSGAFKCVRQTEDGREQIVALRLRGDWLGFDGVNAGTHQCEAIAMDVGEIWTLRYEALMQACMQRRDLMELLHTAMCDDIARQQEWVMSICGIPSDARVAQFLCQYSRELASRGQRTDDLVLRLSRAEIGSYLGMAIETVSRALCRLSREGLIAFPDSSRRHLHIPQAERLWAFVESELDRSSRRAQIVPRHRIAASHVSARKLRLVRVGGGTTGRAARDRRVGTSGE